MFTTSGLVASHEQSSLGLCVLWHTSQDTFWLQLNAAKYTHTHTHTLAPNNHMPARSAVHMATHSATDRCTATPIIVHRLCIGVHKLCSHIKCSFSSPPCTNCASNTNSSQTVQINCAPWAQLHQMQAEFCSSTTSGSSIASAWCGMHATQVTTKDPCHPSLKSNPHPVYQYDPSKEEITNQPIDSTQSLLGPVPQTLAPLNNWLC